METRISIMAGNPRIIRVPEAGLILKQQSIAFAEALKFSRTQLQPRITVFFDHLGKFEDFSDPDLGPSRTARKRNSKILTGLLPHLKAPYEVLGKQLGVNLETISCLYEGVVRMEMHRIVREARNAGKEYIFREILADGLCGTSLAKSGNEMDKTCSDTERINCRGIIAGVLEQVSREADEIFLFWEYDEKRCNPATIHTAILFACECFQIQKKIQSVIFQSERSLKRTYLYEPGKNLQYSEEPFRIS